MARELGLNPKKFGGLANHHQERWKAPLPQFIEELYLKRFGKDRPEVVRTIEELAQPKQKRHGPTQQGTTPMAAPSEPDDENDDDCPFGFLKEAQCAADPIAQAPRKTNARQPKLLQASLRARCQWPLLSEAERGDAEMRRSRRRAGRSWSCMISSGSSLPLLVHCVSDLCAFLCDLRASAFRLNLDTLPQGSLPRAQETRVGCS